MPNIYIRGYLFESYGQNSNGIDKSQHIYTLFMMIIPCKM